MNTVQKSVLDLQFKLINSFKCQSHKMAKHVQTILREIADELFGHFVKLALKGLY